MTVWQGLALLAIISAVIRIMFALASISDRRTLNEMWNDEPVTKIGAGTTRNLCACGEDVTAQVLRKSFATENVFRKRTGKQCVDPIIAICSQGHYTEQLAKIGAGEASSWEPTAAPPGRTGADTPYDWANEA